MASVPSDSRPNPAASLATLLPESSWIVFYYSPEAGIVRTTTSPATRPSSEQNEAPSNAELVGMCRS